MQTYSLISAFLVTMLFRKTHAENKHVLLVFSKHVYYICETQKTYLKLLCLLTADGSHAHEVQLCLKNQLSFEHTDATHMCKR